MDISKNASKEENADHRVVNYTFEQGGNEVREDGEDIESINMEHHQNDDDDDDDEDEDKSDDDDDDDDEDSAWFGRYVENTKTIIVTHFSERKRQYYNLVTMMCLLLYGAYFSGAMYYNFGDEGSIRLLSITATVVVFLMYNIWKKYFGKKFNEGAVIPIQTAMGKRGVYKLRIIIALLLALIVIVALIVEVGMKKPKNLFSLMGIAIYLIFCFIFSTRPSKVRFRTVYMGMVMQFLLGLAILRTKEGYILFKWLGDRATEFLTHSNAGAEFVFGAVYEEHFIAFKVVPVVVFFSTVISIFYHLGTMQWVIMRLGWTMEVFMGTTAAESMTAAGNIFVGMGEAPFMIRPLLPSMTRSEIHAVMTGGFATIAGSVLAAYIYFGVPANHLISASVMSAPAALAVSKLLLPETKKSVTTVKNIRKLIKGKSQNVIDAAAQGAMLSAAICGSIIVNVIAMVSLINFINESLMWFGTRIGINSPKLTFELICSYLLTPLPYIMGAEKRDCRKLAELIGIKTFFNEFIAYERLGKIMQNKVVYLEHIARNGTVEWKDLDIFLVGNGTLLLGGVLQPRSEIIATYALCGFSNFGAIGIMLAVLGVMVPRRRKMLSQIVLRAMIGGNIACLLTACIAGLFYEDTLES